MAEFVLPAKHALNRVEPFPEDRIVEKWPAAAFGGLPVSRIRVDVRKHAAIEDRLPVTPAVVDAIQAHDRTLQIQTDGVGNPRHRWQRLTKERGFVLIARRGDKW